MRILRIDKVEVCGPHSLRVVFSDGVAKRVNLLTLLHGPVFEPVLDPAYFRRVLLDPTAGTVVWPNGADLAPEALYDLPTERAEARRRPATPRRRRTKPAQHVAEPKPRTYRGR
jgi:hypothetical protein